MNLSGAKLCPLTRHITRKPYYPGSGSYTGKIKNVDWDVKKSNRQFENSIIG